MHLQHFAFHSMHFLKVAALALFPLVLCAPSPRQSTSGTIILPADGTVIAPGQEFPFKYDGMADFGISSYNVCASSSFILVRLFRAALSQYTVWLLTSMPTAFSPSINFAAGHYFGRFSEPNFPGMYLVFFSPRRLV